MQGGRRKSPRVPPVECRMILLALHSSLVVPRGIEVVAQERKTSSGKVQMWSSPQLEHMWNSQKVAHRWLRRLQVPGELHMTRLVLSPGMKVAGSSPRELKEHRMY